MSNPRYLVTARKYRPQLFHEVVAQEHVTETLQNALRLHRLAHAYLFSGPRGVGKTTAARILAKAINCTTPPAERLHGTEPCRRCASCQSFEEGRSLNIIEIDAASNNKAEDMRDLRETVRVPPQGALRKVYIIDEVHMLSNAAFNVMLKTLEEPPPYVLFIFATTEPHKVLPTILSRCQRFDFRRIAVGEIIHTLQGICAEEGITAEEAALMLIARKGDGALRDALSAFDQAVALCGTDLRYAELAQAFGVVDTDLYFDVTDHVLQGAQGAMLGLVEQIVRQGYDLQEFLDGLSEHLRNLLVARTMPDTTLIEAAEAIRQRYAEVSPHFAEADLLRLMMIVAEAEEALKSSRQPRLRLEMALLKMASLPHAADLRQTLAKLDLLEQQLREGKVVGLPVAAPGSPPASLRERRSPAPETPPSVVREPSVPRLTQEPEPPAPTSFARLAEAEPPSPPVTPEPPAPAASDEPDVPGVTIPDPYTLSLFGGTAPLPPSPPTPPPATPPIQNLVFKSGPALRKKPGPDPPTPSDVLQPYGDGADGLAETEVATLAAPVLTAAPALQAIAAAWPALAETARAHQVRFAAFVTHATPLDFQGTTLTLAVPDEFHREQLQAIQELLLPTLCAHTALPVQRFHFVIRAPADDDSLADPSAFDPTAYFQRKRQENPVARMLFDQFGTEIVW
jgi:DNA polymerase-3 subunit gamma/tau